MQADSDDYYGNPLVKQLKELAVFVSGIKETEKPMNQEELEKEVHNYFKIHHLHIKDGGRVVYDNDDSPNFMCDIRDIARHFAKWGAERQKEQDDRLIDIIYQQGIEKGKDEIREILKRKEKK